MKRSLEMPIVDRRTDGRMDRTEFIGPLSALPGVQKIVWKKTTTFFKQRVSIIL